jgi:hypothetical protein
MLKPLLSTWWYFQQPTKIEVALASVVILIIVLLHRILSALYLCFLHPLSQFSGPSEAARSRRWIYRISDGGLAEETLEKLHEKYREYQILVHLYILF